MLVSCPVCRTQELRIAAYFKFTARLSCPLCGFRFTVDVLAVADALDQIGTAQDVASFYRAARDIRAVATRARYLEGNLTHAEIARLSGLSEPA
jgi:transposase-like protein